MNDSQIRVRITESDLDELTSYCARSGCTKSALVCGLLRIMGALPRSERDGRCIPAAVEVWLLHAVRRLLELESARPMYAMGQRGRHARDGDAADTSLRVRLGDDDRDALDGFLRQRGWPISGTVRAALKAAGAVSPLPDEARAVRPRLRRDVERTLDALGVFGARPLERGEV